MLLASPFLLLITVLLLAHANGHLHRSNHRRFRPVYDARPETDTTTTIVRAFTELVTRTSLTAISSHSTRTTSQPKSAYSGRVVANDPHQHSQRNVASATGLGGGQVATQKLAETGQDTIKTESDMPLATDFPDASANWALTVHGPYGGPAHIESTGFSCSKCSLHASIYSTLLIDRHRSQR
jgi:hypothetical protein